MSVCLWMNQMKYPENNIGYVEDSGGGDCGDDDSGTTTKFARPPPKPSHHKCPTECDNHQIANAVDDDDDCLWRHLVTPIHRHYHHPYCDQLRIATTTAINSTTNLKKCRRRQAAITLPPSSSSVNLITLATWFTFVLLFTLALSSFSPNSVESIITERRGPEFLVEPQSSIVFLNDTGSIVTCSAKGIPAPTISWTKLDGSPIQPVPGLRQIRKDLLTSQLVYLPFSAANYRQDLHSTTIRCVASNSAGAIQSQDVHIRASVKQNYEVQVYDDFAIKGNTGILRCHIPSFVREYVRVTNWLTYDDVQLHSNLLKGGRYSVLPNGELHVHRISDDQSEHQSSLSSTSTKLQQSSLSSSSKHGPSGKQSPVPPPAQRRLMFRCQTKHLLSGETKLSANYGRLIVTEPQSRMPPKIIGNLRHIVVQSGKTVELPCSTQAHPWPSFAWYRAHQQSIDSILMIGPNSGGSGGSSSGTSTTAKQLNRLIVANFRISQEQSQASTSSGSGDEFDLAKNSEEDLNESRYLLTPYRIAKAGRLVQVDSSLFIRDVSPADSGVYVCMANNSAGQDRFEIELLVRAPLNVAINPSYVLASDGDTVSFNCSIVGSPVSRIQWRRNARPLSAVGGSSSSGSPSSGFGSRLHLFDNDRRLQIKQVRREDKGVFQCIVSNEFESVQAAAELALADDPPAFFNVFSVTEPLKPGTTLSIKCSATGVPLPQIVWTLDGAPLADHGRIRVGDYVSSDGVVNSFVNVTSLRTEDGGIYSCTASNDVHSISHSGRINVFGPAFVRPMKNMTAISGHNIHLHCPAAGYPLESIVWYKKSGSGSSSSSTTSGNRLPQNHRQKSLLNGTLLIEKVDRSSDEDSYRCVVTGSGGSSAGSAGTSKASAELYMRVLVAPVISPFHPPPNLREGMRVMLTCSVVEGDSPVLIQFLKDGEPIHESASMPRRIKLDVTNEFSATLFISSVVADDSGNYTCIASNMAAISTYSIVMKVSVPPKWKIAPADMEAIEGQNVVIDCSASGEPRIWWERAYSKPAVRGGTSLMQSDHHLHLHMDTVLLSSSSSGAVSSSSGSGASSALVPVGANSPGVHNPTHYFRTVVSNSHMHTLENGSLMIRDISEEDSGVYLCQANNGVGSGLSKVIQLKVHVPAHFKSKFSAQTVQKGDSIEFSCECFGESPVMIALAKDRMAMDLDPIGSSTSVASGDRQSKQSIALVEQTVRSDPRYRVLRKYRSSSDPDGLSIVVRIVNVDRRDSSLFTCLASNSFGKDEYNFQLIVQEPPSRPENLHILELDSRSTVVGWSSPYSGNSPLLTYHVEYRQQGSTQSGELGSWEAESSPSQQPQIVSGLAQSSSGPSPTTIIVNKQHSTSNNAANGNVDLSPGGPIYRESIPGTENSFTLRGLKPMCTYEIRLQAENKLGLGPFTQILKIVTKEEAPSGPPLAIHVYPVSARTLQVTFQPPRPDHQNGQLLGYYVGYKALEIDEHFMFKKVIEEHKHLIPSSQQASSGPQSIGNGGTALANIPSGPKEVKITDLRRATKYVVIVQAFNRIGPGPQSEEMIGETLVNDPPRAPLLTSVNVDYDSVELSWTIESGDQSPANINLERRSSSGSSPSAGHHSDQQSLSQSQPEVTGYFLYAKSSFADWEERQVDSAQTSYTFNQLQCGTQYQFYVIAYNSVGKGDPSQAIAVRTKGSAPIAPKNWNTFIVVNSTVAILRLDAWLVNGCEIKHFVVKYRPRTEPDWLVVSSQIYPQQRLVEIVELHPASWYLLNMEAVSDAGSTEETYMFSTLTTSGETIPQLDTISRTLTSATSSGPGSNSASSSSGFSSIQSLTIVIPATCSVIVLTVIIIVACFVLGTKRTSQFESTILTAINGGAGGGGPNGSCGTMGHNQRQASVPNGTATLLCHGSNGTPHHGTPLNSGCDSEPRYGTNLSSAIYDHYGFSTAPNGGSGLNGTSLTGTGPGLVDTFHLSIMGTGDPRKEQLCNGSLPNIELNQGQTGNQNHQNNVAIYSATLGKKRQGLSINSNVNSITTCLDSKLGFQEQDNNQDQSSANHPTNNNNNNGQDNVHYFQTPYALSRIPRNLDDSNFRQQQQMMELQADQQTNVPISTGTATLRPGIGQQHRSSQNGDHVYDMPFPPKWV